MFALANSMLPGNPTELSVDLAVRVASCETPSDRDSSWVRLALVDRTRSLTWRGSKKENRLGIPSLEILSGIGEGLTYHGIPLSYRYQKCMHVCIYMCVFKGESNHDHRRHFFQGHVSRDALQIDRVHVVHSRLQV